MPTGRPWNGARKKHAGKAPPGRESPTANASPNGKLTSPTIDSLGGTDKLREKLHSRENKPPQGPQEPGSGGSLGQPERVNSANKLRSIAKQYGGLLNTDDDEEAGIYNDDAESSESEGNLYEAP